MKPWFNRECHEARKLYHNARKLYNKSKTEQYKDSLKRTSKSKSMYAKFYSILPSKVKISLFCLNGLPTINVIVK